MTATMWIVLSFLTLAGAVLSTIFAALRYWVAFCLFLVVFVIGVVGLAVQAVLTT